MFKAPSLHFQMKCNDFSNKRDISVYESGKNYSFSYFLITRISSPIFQWCRKLWDRTPPLCIVKNRKNGQKPVFTVANSTVLTGFEQQNLKKHDAWKHSKVKGTHDPTKIRFFFIFFKICKKNQSQKSFG